MNADFVTVSGRFSNRITERFECFTHAPLIGISSNCISRLCNDKRTLMELSAKEFEIIQASNEWHPLCQWYSIRLDLHFFFYAVTQFSACVNIYVCFRFHLVVISIYLSRCEEVFGITVNFVQRYYRYQSSKCGLTLPESGKRPNKLDMCVRISAKSQKIKMISSWEIKHRINAAPWTAMQMVFGSHERDCDNKELIYIVDFERARNVLSVKFNMLFNANECGSVYCMQQVLETMHLNGFQLHCSVQMKMQDDIELLRIWIGFIFCMLISWMICGLAHISLMWISFRNDRQNEHILLRLPLSVSMPKIREMP